MFQYAFGRAITQSCPEELSFFQIKSGKSDIDLDIMKFNTKITFLDQNIVKNIYKLPNFGIAYRVERKVLQFYPGINRKVLVETRLNFSEKLKCNPEFQVYDGYWQSYKYFETFNDQIINELQPKLEYMNNISEQKEIEEVNSVSIHIRGGDYLSKKNKNLIPLNGESYYIKAVNRILTLVKNPRFFVFSNDLIWAKNQLRSLEGLNLRFVDNSQFLYGNINDFTLMSKCKHNIIVNSTFSWWAAWLNQNKEKIVIAPKKWYNDKFNDTTVDLIPDSWIRI